MHLFGFNIRREKLYAYLLLEDEVVYLKHFKRNDIIRRNQYVQEMI